MDFIYSEGKGKPYHWQEIKKRKILSDDKEEKKKKKKKLELPH